MMHILGSICRLSLLQNEFPVASSTPLHCSTGRNAAWCLLKCRKHFIHGITVSEVGLKILQKSSVFRVAMHCVLLVLFLYIPQCYSYASRQKAATTCRSEESLQSTLQYSVCRKGIKCHLRTTKCKLVSSVTSRRRASNIWCIPYILCSLKLHQSRNLYNPQLINHQFLPCDRLGFINSLVRTDFLNSTYKWTPQWLTVETALLFIIWLQST